MRLGLCCLFMREPISFRSATAKVLASQTREAQLARLSAVCAHNADSLLLALATVRSLGIGSFRIMSPLFPRMTHPGVGYRLEDLPQGTAIERTLELVRGYATQNGIRLSFHPDQFVVLSSPTPAVVESSLGELRYLGMLAEAVGAEVINLHAGGAYGDKQQALGRFEAVFPYLPDSVRSRLALENDDTSYTVKDLVPVCARLSLPLVYDVHHHRCNPDGLGVEEATRLARESWRLVGREPYCHISSPKNGWQSGNPKPHADYIDPGDFPECWLGQEMTLDVEAKAKELAVLKLKGDLERLEVAK